MEGPAITAPPGPAEPRAVSVRLVLVAALMLVFLLASVKFPVGEIQHTTHACATKDDGVGICRDVAFDAAYYLHGLSYDYVADYTLDDGQSRRDDGTYTVPYWEAAPHPHPSRFFVLAGSVVAVGGALVVAAGSVRMMDPRSGFAALAGGLLLFWIGMVWHITSWGDGVVPDLGLLAQFLALGAAALCTARRGAPEGPPALPSTVK